MNYRNFIATLKSQTSSLPYKQQLQFAVMICKKLYFEYQNFVEIYQWGDADLLMDAINLCENSIVNPVDVDQLKALLSKINLITPDMDDFGGSEIGSYALNASASVYDTLEFIMDQDKIHIFNYCCPTKIPHKK